MTVPATALTDLPERDYETIRSLVRTGDVALCSGTNPFSRVIRWATGTPWSHIAMIVQLDDIDRVMVLEAVARIGVRAVPLSRFISEDDDHHTPFSGKIVIARHRDFAAQCADGGLRRMLEFAFDRLGSPFSTLEVAKISMRIALGALGVKVPPSIAPNDEYFCSEYLAECYARIGIPIPWDGRGFIAPHDFAAHLQVEPVARVAHDPFPANKGA